MRIVPARLITRTKQNNLTTEIPPGNANSTITSRKRPRDTTRDNLDELLETYTEAERDYLCAYWSTRSIANDERDYRIDPTTRDSISATEPTPSTNHLAVTHSNPPNGIVSWNLNDLRPRATLDNLLPQTQTTDVILIHESNSRERNREQQNSQHGNSSSKA